MESPLFHSLVDIRQTKAGQSGKSDLVLEKARWASSIFNRYNRQKTMEIARAVSNAAFEMAADVMCEVDVDYLSLLSKSGKTIADLEDKMLQAIMATPQPMSVDGVYNDRAHSVDGMNFNPDHADLYNMLWQHTGR